MTRALLLIIGFILIIFSFPKIRAPIMGRLFNEGYATPKQLKPESTEVITGTGPSITLFAAGAVLIIVGILI